MLYVTGGLIVICIVAAGMIIAKLYGKAKAELDQKNDNVEVLKDYAKIDDYYDRSTLDVLRDRMREKADN